MLNYDYDAKILIINITMGASASTYYGPMVNEQAHYRIFLSLSLTAVEKWCLFFDFVCFNGRHFT